MNSLILPASKARGGPRHRQVVGMVVEADTESTERSERLKERRALHKGRVPEAADDFETERLLPLTDSDVAEVRDAGFFDPDIGDRRPADACGAEIELEHVVRVVGDASFPGEPRATEPGAVLDASEFVEAVGILMDPHGVGLEDAVHLDVRVLFLGRFVFEVLEGLLKSGEVLALRGELSRRLLGIACVIGGAIRRRCAGPRLIECSHIGHAGLGRRSGKHGRCAGLLDSLEPLGETLLVLFELLDPFQELGEPIVVRRLRQGEPAGTDRQREAQGGCPDLAADVSRTPCHGSRSSQTGHRARFRPREPGRSNAHFLEGSSRRRRPQEPYNPQSFTSGEFARWPGGNLAPR